MTDWRRFREAFGYDSPSEEHCFEGILYSLVFLLSVAVFANVRSRRVRQPVLLIGSYVLYLSWGVWFAGVLLASTVDEFPAREMASPTGQLGSLWRPAFC